MAEWSKLEPGYRVCLVRNCCFSSSLLLRRGLAQGNDVLSNLQENSADIYGEKFGVALARSALPVSLQKPHRLLVKPIHARQAIVKSFPLLVCYNKQEVYRKPSCTSGSTTLPRSDSISLCHYTSLHVLFATPSCAQISTAQLRSSLLVPAYLDYALHGSSLALAIAMYAYSTDGKSRLLRPQATTVTRSFGQTTLMATFQFHRQKPFSSGRNRFGKTSFMLLAGNMAPIALYTRTKQRLLTPPFRIHGF